MSAPTGNGPYDVIIVGAGFFGLTVAEQMAREHGRRVLVLERPQSLGW